MPNVKYYKKTCVSTKSILNELVLFDLSDKTTKRIMGDSPFSFEDLGRRTYEDLINMGRMFCIDAAVSNKMIAVLYDGRRIIETREGPGEKTFIRLFDWNGHTLVELHFDKYYTQVALNENNQELYLLDAEDNIYYFNFHLL